MGPRTGESAVAIVIMLMGASLCLSGILQHVARLSLMAESMMTRKPLLDPGETLLVGAGLLGMAHLYSRVRRRADRSRKNSRVSHD